MNEPNESTAAQTPGRTVHLAVYDTLADWEFGHTTATLAGAGYRVVAVGPDGRDAVTTAGGLRLVPELPLSALRPADSALLILPGAAAWEDGSLAPFAQAAHSFVAAGVPVAAICGATAGLAAAGLLDDRAHTGPAREVLAATGYAGGAHYRDADAVTGRGVVTAGPTDPEAFTREILTLLDVYTPEVRDAWFRLFAHSDATAYPVVAGAM
jgi:putative intracellular protease/amidase